MPLDHTKESTIFQAAAQGDLKVVQELVNGNKELVENRASNEAPPLAFAAFHGRIDVARFLLQSGAYIDRKFPYHDLVNVTSLLIAVMEGQEEMAKFLVSEGANIEALALEDGVIDIVSEDMMNVIYFSRKPAISQFFSASFKLRALVSSETVSKTFAEQFSKLVREGAAILQKGDDGDTLLHCAAMSGNVTALDALLRLNSAPNVIDALNDAELTPILLACFNGNLDVVKYFVSHGYKLKSRDQRGNSAVLLAAESGNVKLLKFLIEDLKLSPLEHDEQGNNALMIAAYSGNLDCLKFMQKYLPIDERNNMGATAFLLAAEFGRTEILQYILSVHKAAIHNIDNNQKTALIRAVCGSYTQDNLSNVDTIRYLISQGAELETEDNQDMTALDHAVGMDKQDILAPLKAASELVECIEGHFATRSVSELLQAGASVHQRHNGKTPLHICAEQDNFIAALALLENDANLEAVYEPEEGRGVIPLEVAQDFGHPALMACFLLFRAKKVQQAENVDLSAVKENAVKEYVDRAFEVLRSISEPLERDSVYYHLGIILKNEMRNFNYAYEALIKVSEDSESYHKAREELTELLLAKSAYETFEAPNLHLGLMPNVSPNVPQKDKKASLDSEFGLLSDNTSDDSDTASDTSLDSPSGAGFNKGNNNLLSLDEDEEMPPVRSSLDQQLEEFKKKEEEKKAKEEAQRLKQAFEFSLHAGRSDNAFLLRSQATAQFFGLPINEKMPFDLGSAAGVVQLASLYRESESKHATEKKQLQEQIYALQAAVTESRVENGRLHGRLEGIKETLALMGHVKPSTLGVSLGVPPGILGSPLKTPLSPKAKTNSRGNGIPCSPGKIKSPIAGHKRPRDEEELAQSAPLLMSMAGAGAGAGAGADTGPGGSSPKKARVMKENQTVLNNMQSMNKPLGGVL